jgi:hypothetical protein
MNTKTRAGSTDCFSTIISEKIEKAIVLCGLFPEYLDLSTAVTEQYPTKIRIKEEEDVLCTIIPNGSESEDIREEPAVGSRRRQRAVLQKYIAAPCCPYTIAVIDFHEKIR